MLDRIKRARTEQGFSLIELLVVVIILGILAAVVVFAVSGINDKGEISACKTDTRTMRTAQEAHFAKHSAYAADEDTLVKNGFLSEVSNLHNSNFVAAAAADDPATTTIDESKPRYTITVADAQCGAVGNLVGETATDY